MPIGMITMMLTNVGLAMFNNWRSRCTSEELQEKQRAFQKAAQERNSERMLQLLREGEVLNEEIEKEMHKDRLKNVETDFDDLLTKVFESHAIQNWPLRVLPMVMKNESLGTKIIHHQDTIALHCIFTPSNNASFNQAVYAGIDHGLEEFCNNHLNDLSSHPVIYYSGAWRSNTAPSGPEISLLKSKLPNLPTVVITPFFPPDRDMVLQIHLWGVATEQFIEVDPEGLSYPYNRNTEYDTDLVSVSIEEFVPLLSCIIGFLSDSYFWSFYGTAPILPSLLKIGAISTDGMSYLVVNSQRRYEELFTKALASNKENNLFSEINFLPLFDGISTFWNEEKCDKEIIHLMTTQCGNMVGKKLDSIEDAIDSAQILFGHPKIIHLISNVEKRVSGVTAKEATHRLLLAVTPQRKRIEYHFAASLHEFHEQLKMNAPLQSHEFTFKVISNNAILGFYEISGLSSEYIQALDLFACYESIGAPSGVYTANVNNFKAKSTTCESLLSIVFDTENFDKYYAHQCSILEAAIALYDEIDDKTDIGDYIDQLEVFSSFSAIEEWIVSNAKNKYTGFSLFKGYCKRQNKYVIFGFYRIDKALQLKSTMLVSYYRILPSDISSKFKDNIQYTLIFK